MKNAHKINRLVAIVCLLSGIAFAQEKPKATTVEELGASRARAQAAVHDLHSLLIDSTYGPNREYSQKVNDISYCYSKMSLMLQTAIQQESAKPAEIQNKVLLADCASMQAYISDRWNRYTSIELPPLNVKMGEIYILCREGINPAIANLMALDVPSNKLKLDLGPLKDMYMAIEAKCAELKKQMQEGVAGINKLAVTWDEDLKTIIKLTGQKIN